MNRKHPRGFYCTRAERAAIGARAAAAELSVSRLILDLARDDIADRPVAALTAEEMAELLDGFRALAAFLRGPPDRTADTGVSRPTGPGAGGQGDGDVADRSGPLPAERVRLSISATDEEWAAVHRQALRRGLSRSRYLVGLALPDASVAGPPLPALSGVEQRELLEGVRRLCALLSETGDPGAASAGMRDRLAALPDAAGSDAAGDGRKGKTRTRTPGGCGGKHAGTGVAGSGPRTPPAAAEPSKPAEEAGTGPEPSGQGALF